jgi:catechol 2,3-dioxygenase-like lactoylglutathione lyase family enzyme
MTAAVTGIDHVVIGVADLDRAEVTYRRLGFTLSPRARHSAAMGTANHTIMLEHEYFELLAVLTPTDRNARWREALRRADGVVGVAAATPSAAATREAWTAAGFDPGEVVAFSRQVERPGGVRTEARFETVSLPKDTLPALSLFACEQLTREAVWLPELMSHSNTVVAIRKLSLSVSDPVAASRQWARAFSGSGTSSIAGGVRIRLPRHAIDFLEADVAGRRYRLGRPLDHAKCIALDFAVRSMDACREALAQGRVKAEPDGDGIAIRADEACGVAITMAPASSPV